MKSVSSSSRRSVFALAAVLGAATTPATAQATFSVNDALLFRRLEEYRRLCQHVDEVEQRNEAIGSAFNWQELEDVCKPSVAALHELMGTRATTVAGALAKFRVAAEILIAEVQPDDWPYAFWETTEADLVRLAGPTGAELSRAVSRHDKAKG